MSHREYTRLVTGADTAVLFIHGILGTPRHFDFLLPVVPEDVSIYVMLLDGHGKGVQDFSKTSMTKWRQQVAQKVRQLAQSHKKVLIAAHSMGTLFALEQAAANPGTVSALFQLAAPLRIHPKVQMFANVAKVYTGKIKPEDAMAVATQQACSVRNDERFWQYFGWVARYLELFAQIRAVRQLLPQVKVPCWVYHSACDEMVGAGAVKELKRLKYAQVCILENSAHFYYEQRDLEYLQEQFRRWLRIYR